MNVLNDERVLLLCVQCHLSCQMKPMLWCHRALTSSASLGCTSLEYEHHDVGDEPVLLLVERGVPEL